MPGYVFPPPAAPSVTVEGEQARCPVRRIFCVGRNYAAHAREMGHDPTREPPFYRKGGASGSGSDKASLVNR